MIKVPEVWGWKFPHFLRLFASIYIYGILFVFVFNWSRPSRCAVKLWTVSNKNTYSLNIIRRSMWKSSENFIFFTSVLDDYERLASGSSRFIPGAHYILIWVAHRIVMAKREISPSADAWTSVAYPLTYGNELFETLKTEAYTCLLWILNLNISTSNSFNSVVDIAFFNKLSMTYIFIYIIILVCICIGLY